MTWIALSSQLPGQSSTTITETQVNFELANVTTTTGTGGATDTNITKFNGVYRLVYMAATPGWTIQNADGTPPVLPADPTHWILSPAVC